jgi:hypothetical protein
MAARARHDPRRLPFDARIAAARNTASPACVGK